MIKREKYIYINDIKMFVGEIIASELDMLNNYILDSLDDYYIYYSQTRTKNLFTLILDTYENIGSQIDVLIDKYWEPNFKKNKNWSKILINDLTSLYSFVQIKSNKFSPSTNNMIKNKIYINLHELFSDILNKLSVILYDYLKIVNYKAEGPDKYYPELQTSISIADNYDDDFELHSHRSGFIDLTDNSIIQKEIVSFRHSKDAKSNIEKETILNS